MQFPLAAADAEALAAFQRLCRDVIRPRARATDKAGVFPRENYRALAEFGYLSIGHTEMSPALIVLMQETLGASCASTFLAAGASGGLFGLPLSRFGSEAQKRWVPRVLAGDAVGAFALTEAHAGSDVQAMKTRAVQRGGQWFLSGEKMWITNAPCCDVALVFARNGEGIDGVSLFLVEKGARGLVASPPIDKLGFRGSPTGGLAFDDTPADLVGEPGQGFLYAMQTLANGRVAMAALSVGITQAALDEGIAYTRQRVAFGKPLAKFQDVQFQLADIATEIELARTLTVRAAQAEPASDDARTLASMAKLFASELATRATDAILTLHGAAGYSEEMPIARLHRDARLLPIGEGASAVQRMLIAPAVLG